MQLTTFCDLVNIFLTLIYSMSHYYAMYVKSNPLFQGGIIVSDNCSVPGNR